MLATRLARFAARLGGVAEGAAATAPGRCGVYIESLSAREVVLGTDTGLTSLGGAWLRDHCPSKIHQEAQQRLEDVAPVCDISDAAVKGSELVVTWADGHTSKFETGWIAGVATTKHANSPLHPAVLPGDWTERTAWNGSTLPLETLGVHVDDMMSSDQTLLELARTIRKYGVGQVHGVTGKTENALLDVASRLGSVRTSYFGTVFGIRGDLEHIDIGYDSGDLPSHTDASYFTEAPGLIVFHMVQPSATGGQTVMTDGYNITEQLRAAHPDSYDILTRVNVPCHYLEPRRSQSNPGCYYIASQPTIRVDPDSGRMVQFRYNNEDRAPMSIYCEEAGISNDDFYRAWEHLTALVRDPANEVWVSQQPGTITFIDNWRVTHGRSAFQGSREVHGVYINREEFDSRQRVLEAFPRGFSGCAA